MSTEKQLIVTSKVKAFNKAAEGLNTSAEVIEVLSSHVAQILQQAQQCAKNDGRKTVMKRDVETVITPPKVN